MVASVLARAFMLVVLVIAIPVSANPFLVTVDTSALAGTDADIAFDLIDGGPPANTITLSSFATDGMVGGSSSTGDVSGAFPGIVTIGDTTFFNEYLQNVILGTTFSFVLESTNLPEDVGSIPDGFSLLVLDHATGLSLVPTSDPTGADTLFLWSLGAAAPEIYTSDLASVSIGPVPPVNGVPEPSTLLLATLGLLVLITLATRGAKRAQLIRGPYGA